ncbi:MAG: CHAT domain-containing protein [candidate division KSB1 bacterium]|nr:CHAT domain-containing protein [candidate division KSB1 bacterium]MDZ7304726.1 CHAT domain-containing protein [candidate division KSB1 bacterium]MDZ7312781.1 CHAT domain-containing protein [candidate division KSB1 bacterium]
MSVAQTPHLAEPYPITTHPEADLMPALSPDGRWIAYVSRANKNYDIWVKPAAGGLATPLTTHTSDDYSPAWSPDGKSLAFISRRDDAEGDLYLLAVKYRDGTLAPGKLRHLQHNLQREAYPAFSPDGKKIAFSAGPAGREQIWIYEIKTKKTYPLTKHGGTQPAWSPDGTQIALACPTANQPGNQIFLIDTDTMKAESSRRQITFEGDNQFPTWSPDGQKILVQRSDQQQALRKSHLRLITLPIAPATVHELQLTPAREDALFPFWGKNRMIYYAADHYGNLDIWRLPETGTVPRSNTPQEACAMAQAIADPEMAILAFSALQFYFPDSTRWLCRGNLEIGRRYLALKDTMTAKAIFEKVLQEDRELSDAAAFAEIELAKLARDSRRFAEISAHSQGWPVVQAFCALETGKALQEEGKIEAALQYFQNIPRQFPNVHEVCYEALLRAGDMLVMLDRAEAGEASYLKIITAYPHRQDWHAVAINRLLDTAPQLELTSDTLAAYQRVRQKYGSSSPVAHAARFRIAERLSLEGETKLAINEYQNLIAALENQPDAFLQTLRAEAMGSLIRLYVTENEFPAATQIYLKLIEQYPQTPELRVVREARQELTAALIQRARLLARARDYELARTLFMQARQYDPQNIEAHRGYLETMQALDRIDEAISEYNHSTRTNPGDEIALYSLGLAHSYKGENNAGILRHSATLIERALGMNYRLVPAYLTLGFNYEAIEKLEQKERERKKSFGENVALTLPRLLDNVRRTITFRPPKPPTRWYEKAIEALTIAIALNDEQADPQMEGRLALNLANNYYNLGEFGFENAFRYYLIKLRYDSTFVSTRQKAIVYERIGECGWAIGRSNEAVPYLRQALQLSRELRDVDGELRNLQRLALLYQGKGDFESSIEYYNKIDTVSRRENRREHLALVWRNMAYNHQQNKESDEAILKSRRAIALLEQTGKSAFPQPKKEKFTIKLLDFLPIFWMTVDPIGESTTEGLTYDQEQALVYSIMGESQIAEKDFREAIALFEKKTETFRRRKDKLGEAIALNNLGNLWYSYHDFDQAFEYFYRSFKLCEHQQWPAGKIINLVNMGNIAWLQGSAAASRTVDSLLQTCTVDIEQVSLQSPRQKLAVLNTLGNLHFHSAERHFDVSKRDNHDFANNIEQTYLALQSLSWAQAAYDSALVVAKSSRLFREEVIVRRNLASSFLLSGDSPFALEQLKAAHEICIAKNFGDLTWRVEHAIANVSRFLRLPPEHELAQKSALAWYLSAIRILEGLPEEPEGSEQRLSESEEQIELYENAVALLAGQGDHRTALELAERARSNRFVNLISTRYILPKKERHRLIWGGGGGEAPHLQRLISRLRGELAKLEAEDPQRPKELARVRNELAAAENEYQQVVQKALAEDPELASFFSIQSLNTQALQDSLDAETAILEYFVTENELIIWLLSRELLEQFRVSISREQLREHIAQLRKSWFEHREDGAALARELGALLLGSIRGLEKYHRLLIVPDDGLHYLPFAALEYHGSPLVDHFIVVKTPSLLALKFAERHQNLNENNLLILQDARSLLLDNFAFESSGLRVAAWRGVDWFSAGTTERQKIQQAGILHIQHRFVVQPQRPLDSGFWLTLATPENAEPDTMLIPLYRLFELDLSASLVVLGNTSFPYQVGRTGDEMIALQRSLIYAGAPTLIYSQWSVPSKVRETFLNVFYRNLASVPVAMALRAAQEAVRERYPDPYHWAGFELVGFPGMSATEKKEFAHRYFEETVSKGNNAQELGEFLDAVRYYQSALAMAQQLGDEQAVQRLHLLIKASAISANDYATACEIETKILESAIAANDIKQQARSYRNLSVWQLQSKNYAAAIAAEEKYLALAEQAHNPLAAADSRMQHARIFEAAGNYAAAIPYAEQAAEIYEQQNQTFPRFQAKIFLGRLALQDDQYGAALNYLENAVLTFLEIRQPTTPVEQRTLATAYQLIGVVYSRLTAYGQALTFHQKAWQIFEAIADTTNLGRAEQYLADTYWLNGEYQDALFHQQRALKAARHTKEKLLGQTTLGLILLSLGEFDAALDAEKQALLFALEIGEVREQATVHKNLGLVYVQKQQPQQALASFKQAAELDRQAGFERGLLYDYLFLAQAFQALAQSDSALAYLAQTERLALHLDDRRAYSKALYTKGLTFLDRGNKALARTAFTAALAKAEEIKLDEMQWRCLWRLGALARQSGELEPALNFYTQAVGALERQSAKIKIEEYRSGFIDNKAEIYEEAVLLLLHMNRTAEAFAMAERAKSRSFADLLANSKIDWRAGADRELLDHRDRLLDRISLAQGKINALQQKPATESTRFEINALNDTLNALQKEYSNILVALKTANPELADMVSVDPLPLPELQSMLADSARLGNVALVEYFFAKDRLVSWVVDRNQARAVITPLDRNRLNESIVQFRRAITKRASTETFSRELYDLLIKPIEPMVQSATQLVIVPHGILHYLPFPALQRADSTYLIDHHALALAPSATVLGFCYCKGNSLLDQRTNFRVLALGNPEVGNPRLDLPFAEKEIKSLEQTFGQIQSHARRQATASALIAGARQANLIHLSCHGVYDERNPLFSALLLAPDSSNATGRLEAFKIFGLQLNASLVMLSACETGLAKVTGGDEVIGLARSFIFAGTPSLIASLWTVDDLATAITVKRFYRYLKSGMSKAEALREAQRFVRDNHNRHPAYWASFGLTGDWR